MELHVIRLSRSAAKQASLLRRRYNLAIGVPVEVTAATILLTFWDPSVQRIPLYTTILVVCGFLDLIGERR
jgi:amino acid permease